MLQLSSSPSPPPPPSSSPASFNNSRRDCCCPCTSVFPLQHRAPLLPLQLPQQPSHHTIPRSRSTARSIMNIRSSHSTHALLPCITPPHKINKCLVACAVYPLPAHPPHSRRPQPRASLSSPTPAVDFAFVTSFKATFLSSRCSERASSQLARNRQRILRGGALGECRAQGSRCRGKHRLENAG